MSRKHIFGNINRVSYGFSFFDRVRQEDFLYVDKTAFIEHFLSDTAKVSLICRPRRCGKSLNMDTLRCFLTDRDDNRELFKGLAIEASSVWDMINSAPVFHFNFANLGAKECDQALFYEAMSCLHFYFPDLSRSELEGSLKNEQTGADVLRLLTQTVYEATGKKSYILIDEYNKPLLDTAGTEQYDEISEFLTSLLSAAFIDNPALEKALLIGVMRTGYEELFDSLGDAAVVYDVFNGSRYQGDFNITEGEMDELSRLCAVDADLMRKWYGGLRVGKEALYNILSVGCFLQRGNLDTFWGNTGTMGLVTDALAVDRLRVLSHLAAGEQMTVPITSSPSMEQIGVDDASFYSLLIHAGYLGVVDCTQGSATACVPNQELLNIWRKLISESVLSESDYLLRKAFNENSPERFSSFLEQVMSDVLMRFDLGGDADYVLYIALFGGVFFHFIESGSLDFEFGVNGGCAHCLEVRGKIYVFDFMCCPTKDGLDAFAESSMRYLSTHGFVEYLNTDQPIWNVVIVFSGDKCKVKCAAARPRDVIAMDMF